jgi:hypothetical protein
MYILTEFRFGLELPLLLVFIEEAQLQILVW